ncbi:uncharacterized protein PFL1_02633 [Pseudozyma flocculosa PF-1]|uniref:Uncharacterized protein n=2 Tax=Pseudozyma flocculosa TaxID=84751 RepID=A0A5C3EZP5_9BASI|nr:uncharacterized protein PFL1_02633 [Pseudozyma flocculosa PF-1]EPQ29961.1 hypothetical protein PFL1_02633 [Pseudozyma flocculosa PF-1]SPO37275.1 uncharacterized protein PSFLO_02747 [Pseudozyma flocculosa]
MAPFRLCAAVLAVSAALLLSPALAPPPYPQRLWNGLYDISSGAESFAADHFANAVTTGEHQGAAGWPRYHDYGVPSDHGAQPGTSTSGGYQHLGHGEGYRSAAPSRGNPWMRAGYGEAPAYQQSTEQSERYPALRWSPEPSYFGSNSHPLSPSPQPFDDFDAPYRSPDFGHAESYASGGHGPNDGDASLGRVPVDHDALLADFEAWHARQGHATASSPAGRGSTGRAGGEMGRALVVPHWRQIPHADEAEQMSPVRHLAGAIETTPAYVGVDAFESDYAASKARMDALLDSLHADDIFSAQLARRLPPITVEGHENKMRLRKAWASAEQTSLIVDAIRERYRIELDGLPDLDEQLRAIEFTAGTWDVQKLLQLIRNHRKALDPGALRAWEYMGRTRSFYFDAGGYRIKAAGPRRNDERSTERLYNIVAFPLDRDESLPVIYFLPIKVPDSLPKRRFLRGGTGVA